MAATALPAASLPASSVKCSRRVHTLHPEPLASRASTIAVAEADMKVASSVWGSGIAVEAIAMRSCRIVTSPPRMRPSPLRPASSGTRSASREEVMNARRPPAITFQPASTSSASETSMSRGS